MFKVLVVGAGKIGTLITCLLTGSGAYHVYLADLQFDGDDIRRLKSKLPELETLTLDVTQSAQLSNMIRQNGIQAVVSALPYAMNTYVAKAAAAEKIHYFDLTEDVQVTSIVKQLAANAKQAFVPQCGLAPGFINIVATDVMKNFDKLDCVKMRVGALPQNPSNSLLYALTWSTDGLINEYGNPCEAIEGGKLVSLPALESLEFLQLDGTAYEAFNTSGGLATLANSFVGKVREMNYKTIRYPGHCEKIRFLMNDLRLNEDRSTLKKIFEQAIPKTFQDVVIVFVSATGWHEGVFIERNFARKYYPQTIAGMRWTAIQVTTACGVTSVLDLVLQNPSQYQGMIGQERFNLQEILHNRFGQYYEDQRAELR